MAAGTGDIGRKARQEEHRIHKVFHQGQRHRMLRQLSEHGPLVQEAEYSLVPGSIFPLGIVVDPGGPFEPRHLP